jgi:hypothetical protein
MSSSPGALGEYDGKLIKLTVLRQDPYYSQGFLFDEIQHVPIFPPLFPLVSGIGGEKFQSINPGIKVGAFVS